MSWLTGILLSMFQWLIAFEQPKIVAWLSSLYANYKQKKEDTAAQEAALKKQADDLKDPKISDEELSKDAENILNNNKP